MPPQETIVRAGQPRRAEYQLAKTLPARLRSRALGCGRLLAAADAQLGLPRPARRRCTRCCCWPWTTPQRRRRASACPASCMIAVMFGLTLFFAAGLTVGRRQRHSTRCSASRTGWSKSAWASAALVLWRAAVRPPGLAAADHRRGVPVRPVLAIAVGRGGRALPAGRQPVRGEPQRAVRRPGHPGLQGLPADAHRARTAALTIYPIGAGLGRQAVAGRPGRAGRTRPGSSRRSRCGHG